MDNPSLVPKAKNARDLLEHAVDEHAPDLILFDHFINASEFLGDVTGCRKLTMDRCDRGSRL